MAEILNEFDAREAAKKIVNDAQKKTAEKKSLLENTLRELGEIKGEEKGFEGVALLLTMPEENFALLAPVFLAELEQSMRNTNDQLAIAQALNASGIRLEDITTEYQHLCDEIDVQMDGVMSAQKRAFVKRLLAIIYNSASETEGITKRNMLIPIEYCHPDAKMPAYAHLTDAGMDIYLTEDITIHPGETKLIPTGLKVALPLGYELQVRPKSGRSLKSKLRIANTPGTIDAGYRDEIGIIVDNIDPVIRSAEIDDEGRLYNVLWGSNIMLSKGEKIAQLVLSEVPKAVFYEVENVSAIENDGRKGGFGSTGVK